MPLVSTKDILGSCSDGRYAVGAFNINGLDQPRALIEAAERLKSPILVVEPGVIEPYVDFVDFALVTRRAAEAAGVPVGIHLSHAGDLEQFERACKAGFTSVMYDGSKLPYEENVANTRTAVEIGRKHGCAVEGELGALGSSFANISESMTDPALAKDFVQKTGVDILAVAIGNAHGFYKGKPSLDFKRLEEIRYALMPQDCYLTLHGGTGIPEDHIRRSIEMGIVKICIYTEMCAQGKAKAKEYIAEHPDYEGNADIPEMIRALTGGYVDAEEDCIRMFMSNNKVSRLDTYAPFKPLACGSQGAACPPGNAGTVASGGAAANSDPGPDYPSADAVNKSAGTIGVFWNNNV